MTIRFWQSTGLGILLQKGNVELWFESFVIIVNRLINFYNALRTKSSVMSL